MTQNISNGEQKELSWEEAVIKYLEENPDFFNRYPELTANLTIPHPGSGEAVSLIERQVKVLREKNNNLEQQLHGLVVVARENDALSSRLHDFGLAMIDTASLDDALDTAREKLQQEFKLDTVVIRLHANSTLVGTRPEFVDPNDKHMTAVLDQFQSSKPICGAELDSKLLSYIFGKHNEEIKSTAIAPLNGNGTSGVLCLGSKQPKRFHPDMGTSFLLKVSELLMRSLDRFLN